MRKSLALILAALLVLSGCQTGNKPDKETEGMLPAPQQEVINNELSGITLEQANAQLTQTAPVKVKQEIVELTITETELEGCEIDACKEAVRSGLKGSAILAGTKIDPGMVIFQLFENEQMKAHPLTTKQGTWDQEQLQPYQCWTNGQATLINVNTLLNRTENEDHRMIIDQICHWMFDKNAVVGSLFQEYRVPQPELFGELEVKNKKIENVSADIAYLKQSAFPAGVVDRKFTAVEGLTLNGDGYVVSVTFNKKGREAVTLPVFVIQQIAREKVNPESVIQLQDQTIPMNNMPQKALIDQNPKWIVIDAGALYFDDDVASRFVNAVGSKERRKDYLWAEELVEQMRNELVAFYRDQIGK